MEENLQHTLLSTLCWFDSSQLISRTLSWYEKREDMEIETRADVKVVLLDLCFLMLANVIPTIKIYFSNPFSFPQHVVVVCGVL